MTKTMMARSLDYYNKVFTAMETMLKEHSEILNQPRAAPGEFFYDLIAEQLEIQQKFFEQDLDGALINVKHLLDEIVSIYREKRIASPPSRQPHIHDVARDFIKHWSLSSRLAKRDETAEKKENS